MKVIIVLFLASLIFGCGSTNSSNNKYTCNEYEKCDTYLDTVVGKQNIKISSDSLRLYVSIRDQGEHYIDTIHHPISKDYDNLTKNIYLNGEYLCNCFVEENILFFSFTDFSFFKYLVAVNLITHKIVDVKDGQDMLGTHLGAFIFIDDKIICDNSPNLLDSKDLDLLIYRFAPDRIVYFGAKNIKIDVMKLYSDDSSMTSFLKITYDQMRGVSKR